MERFSIDVVIPTFCPDDKLNKIMDRLQRQTYPINKIIMINTEKRGLVGFDFSGIDNLHIEHIARKDFDHGITRNYALSLSDAQIVVFMTQDAVPTGRKLIEELVKPFEDPDVYVTYGRQLPRNHCEFDEVFTRQFNYPNHDIVKTKSNLNKMGIKTYFNSDVCAAYRRQKHIELGGFPSTIFNEDSLFAAKVIANNKKIYYASKAMVVHSHNYTCRQQLCRNFDIGVTHEQFKDVYKGIKSENEGIRLVEQTTGYLLKIRKPYLIPKMIMKSGCKYLGYKLGKMYKIMPKSLIMKLTLSPYYWQKKWDRER